MCRVFTSYIKYILIAHNRVVPLTCVMSKQIRVPIYFTFLLVCNRTYVNTYMKYSHNTAPLIHPHIVNTSYSATPLVCSKFNCLITYFQAYVLANVCYCYWLSDLHLHIYIQLRHNWSGPGNTARACYNNICTMNYSDSIIYFVRQR